ncbi:DUF502 domain-containing protein [Candidatus Latescibacterota bacterium]
MEKNIKQRFNFLRKIRNYFTTGVFVLAPTAVSIWILFQIFRWFDNILGKWYTALFTKLNLERTHIPGLGALTLFIVITLIGVLARQYVGRKLLGVWEKGIEKVPLINRVYIAVRQLSDSFAKGGGIIFQRPVMIEYPRKGIFSIGFVTRRCEGPFCKIIGQEVSTVFVPTTPNPTSGVLIFVPQQDMIPLEMSVEDAMKLIISAGTVSPDIRLPVVKENQWGSEQQEPSSQNQ